MDNKTIPAIIHTTAKRRENHDLGALSPYLYWKLALELPLSNLQE